MLGGIRIIAGPALSGKTQRLLARYRQVLADEPPGAALWLVPHYRAAGEVRDQILTAELGGCLNPNCLTFDQFARRLLDTSRLPMRPIGPLLKREILRRLIGEALGDDRLDYFRPIAETTGFLELVVEFIEELKRLEIWPEEIAAVCRRATDKEREMSDLYGRYQQLLTQHDLYDAQGRFWSARELLRQGKFGAFDGLRHVFVDGFTDFTRTEHEMLELLAGRVESLSVTLPLEAGDERSELFDKPRQTLAALTKRHPLAEIESIARRPSTWSAMDHLEQHLFADPREPSATQDATGIEIVAAAGVTDEIETLARRIKRLLLEGDPAAGIERVAPQDVLVVFRSLGESAELVEEVFAEFGLPVAISHEQTLARSPLMSALVGWLRLDLEDWPFRQLLAVLVHNYFRPAWPQWRQGRAAAAAERVIRWLQIPAGRAALLGRVDRLVARDSQADDPEGPPPIERVARLASPLLTRMAQALDALPRQATLAEWGRAWTDFARATGLLPDDARNPSPDETADVAVWQQLLAALEASTRLSTWLGEKAKVLSRREAFDHLLEVLRCEPLASAMDETGRVRVVGAESARNLSIPYVFLAGLSESSFPRSQRENCLAGEAETRQLIAAGLPLVPHAARSRFEMLLFYEVVTRATRRLVLSYPALDASAQPLTPSPYLREVEHVFPPGQIHRKVQNVASGIPSGGEVALCPRDYRTLAVSETLGGDGQSLVQLLRKPASTAAARNIVAGLRASNDRQRGERFGPFEGMLDSAAAAEILQQRYGAQRIWSPSQLEQYARCPFQFYLEKVLRLEPFDDPLLAVDYAERGRIMHWILSALHRQLNDRQQAATSPCEQSAEAFARSSDELLSELLAKMRSDDALAGGLREIDARRVAAWLKKYYVQHQDYDAGWQELESPPRPAYFEVSFGPRRKGASDGNVEEDEDRLSTTEPFELDCGGETIRFAGRIDRIDLGTIGEQVVFNVVDYKSSASTRTSTQAIRDGNALQLPLYALAAEKILAQQRALPFRAAYWHVASRGYKEAIQFRADSAGRLSISPEWKSLEQSLRVRVRSLVAGIRGGQFPMHSTDENCTSYCAYSTVCRVHQSRSLEKQWEPPAEKEKQP